MQRDKGISKMTRENENDFRRQKERGRGKPNIHAGLWVSGETDTYATYEQQTPTTNYA